jgi:large subunit ribosomal protein L30
MDQAYIKITLIKSKIGAIPKQRATVEALGLRKLNSSVIQKDNPQIRGMIHKIKHMVKVEQSPKKA